MGGPRGSEWPRGARRPKGVEPHLTLAEDADQAGIAEDAEVIGDGGLGHLYRRIRRPSLMVIWEMGAKP